MPDLGKKYSCYNCGTKFYDLGKPVPLCPKCGADQRESDETPVITTSRSRRAPVVVEEPEEPEFAPEGEAPAADAVDDEEEIVTRDEEPAEEDDDEEEEEY